MDTLYDISHRDTTSAADTRSKHPTALDDYFLDVKERGEQYLRLQAKTCAPTCWKGWVALVKKIKGTKHGFCENILHIDVLGDKLW